jgi:hypothetical protein
MAMRRTAQIVAVVVIATGVLSCTADDDGAATSTSSTTGPARPTLTSIAPTAPTSTSGAVPTTATPGTTGGTATSPPVTTGAPTPAERLAARLPDGRRLGVDAAWAERVLSSDLDDVPADEVDPFNGLLDCPGGAPVPTDADLWVERRFTGTEPVDGMIMVRIVAIEENDAQAARRIAALGECTPVSPEVFIERSRSQIDATPVDVTELFGSATGTLPFPPALAHVVAHDDDLTVGVTVLGLNEGVGFARQASAQLRRVLDTL